MGEPLVHVTSYGRPAAMLLRQRISAAKADDPLRPVTVVVPTNYVGVSTRRMLATGALGSVTDRGVGVAGLALLTVYRLAELLGAAHLAAAGRRPVSTPVVAAAVRRVLAEAPGMFAPVREHPSTEEALVRAHRELSEVPADRLDTLAGASERASEVVRVHRAVRTVLDGSWYAEADLMASARQATEEAAAVAADLGTVLVYLPQDLSLSAAGLLRALAGVCPLEVVAARTGAAAADADVDRTLHRLGVEAPADAGPGGGVPAATAIVSVSDAEEEVRSAVERIVEAARAGTPLERMAVLYPSPRPYARIVDEHLTAAGIAYNGRGIRPLADRLAGRWLLALLGLPDARCSRPAVMALLADGPVRGEHGRRIPAAAWERISREAGVVHGADEWRTKLDRYAGDMRRLAAEEEEEEVDDPRPWLVARARRNADQAEALARFVGDLFARLGEAGRLTRWSDLAAWCQEMLERHLGGDRQRDGWPEDERGAAERVEAALDRLAGLEAVEEATDLRTFRRTLQLELDDDLGKVGELGQGLLTGTTSAALGVDLDVVVVLGLAEGVMPAAAREDSLLPDHERAVVGDALRPRGERLGVEHRHLLAALAAADSEAILTFPRGDLRRSIERAPSRWLLDAAARLRGDGRRMLPDPGSAAGTDWYTHVASFAQRARTTAFPPTRQAYGLRALADGPRGTALLRHRFVATDPVLRAGVALVLGRRSDAFTRFDGNLSVLTEHLVSPAAHDAIISPSRLETWLACPHAYLLESLLRVEPVENPEELLEISALERGSLVHVVLETWLRDCLDGQLPAPDEAWPAAARRRLLEIAEEACRAADERGATGHPLLWRRDRRRLLADLERFLAEDDQRRAAEGLVPVAAERPFGLPGTGTEPLTVDLGDGRSVRVRGRIDRIDRTLAGALVVTDYKTGGTSRYADLKPDQPLGDGAKLQLALYGLVARADDSDAGVVTRYWFVSSRGEFKQIGYPLTDAVVDELRRALRVAVDGIASGHFPMRPPEPTWRPYTPCRYCDPDELGTADRYRDWERIRLAADLRDYVAYIEPDTLAEAGQGGRA